MMRKSLASLASKRNMASWLFGIVLVILLAGSCTPAQAQVVVAIGHRHHHHYYHHAYYRHHHRRHR